MRDASNGERIARKIHNKTGIRLEIIDGQQEARIVYDSHVADLLDREGTYLYVDVGGGSTEISLSPTESSSIRILSTSARSVS